MFINIPTVFIFLQASCCNWNSCSVPPSCDAFSIPGSLFKKSEDGFLSYGGEFFLMRLPFQKTKLKKIVMFPNFTFYYTLTSYLLSLQVDTMFRISVVQAKDLLTYE